VPKPWSLDQVAGGGVGVGGRGDEALDLVADEMADLVEEALFGDRGALVEAPVVEAHDHRRDMGEVDDRADPVGVKELARAELADDGLRGARRHGVGVAGAVGGGGSSSRPPSLRMRAVVASTSRSELRQVKVSQAPSPADLRRPMVRPSLLVR
jgi:hypothetical protein